MVEKVLVDVCVPREVSERLEDLGLNTIYLTELFTFDEDDEEIFEWMEENEVPILTKDKNFPENGGNLKITLKGESTVKLTRQATKKLMELQIYPDPLIGGWEKRKKNKSRRGI